uniref:hypothetical protein n=1 Tax=Candidatus Scatousia sp. TaxID=3085663 RepID=UPI004027D5BF
MVSVDTAATAIFGNNGISAGTSSAKKTSEKKSSFQDELNSAKTEDVKENSVTEAEPETKEVNKKEDKKTDQKEEKSADSEKEDNKVQKNEEVQGTNNEALKGEVSANNSVQDYSALSEQVKSFILKNGGQLNLNSVNLMTASTRAEISAVAPSVDYSSIKMSDTDAKFFSDLVKKTDMSAQSVAAEFQKALEGGNVQQVQSTAKATAALIANLQESAKNNQPFRIDFDKDISVILKVDKEGKINANFIPGDKAVEAYLRNNIEFLKQRFNEENIAYGDLNYSKSRQEKQKQDRNNKEQNNE